MWKYLSTGAPAFRNFRLVAPDWRGWKQRFTSGKGQNRSRWICIYVWCIAERGGKGEERASWARSERFSLAFHGMRSCFKILVNLASLSPCTHTYIYIYIYSIYVYRPPYISCRLSFRQCQSRRNRLFPSLPPFLPFLFPSLAPFVLVNNAIYIYSTENIRWLTFLPLLPFPISSFFSLLLLFLFFFSPLSPLRFTQSRRRVLPSMAEKCFHRPPGVYLAFLRKFIQRCRRASPRFTLHLSRCNDPLLLSPQQDRWILLPLILPGNERTRGNFTPRIYLLVYDNMLKSSAWV